MRKKNSDIGRVGRRDVGWNHCWSCGSDGPRGTGFRGLTLRPTENLCGDADYNIAFGEDVHLVVTSGITTIGPFAFNVPAGTYDLTVWTHLGEFEVPSQDMEQWFFTTDSGYTSPVSTDTSPSLPVGRKRTSE